MHKDKQSFFFSKRLVLALDTVPQLFITAFWCAVMTVVTPVQVIN